MSALAQLPIHDLRPRLSVKPNPAGFMVSRRPRQGTIQGVVIHYNGPALPFLPNPQREIDFVARVDTPNHQSRIGADSLQYHFIVLSNGEIWQGRNLEYIAWHAAHSIPNESYVAIHLPLGGQQDATPAQWAAVEQLIGALRADHGFGRSTVTGHKEWSATSCPGRLMERVLAYRAGRDEPPVVVPAPSSFSVTVTASPMLRIRQGASTKYPIAGSLKSGEQILVDGEKDEGEGVWLHLLDQRGFIKREFTVRS